MSIRKSRAKLMTDEEISHLTVPQLIDLIKRLAEEVEIRMMEIS